MLTCPATGCGSSSQRVARAHWKADADGVIRVTYRFPETMDATNINPAQLFAEGEVLPPTDAFISAVRSALQAWEVAARRDGIRIVFIEVSETDATAKVDWLLATVPDGYAGKYFPYMRSMATGELGRIVVKIRPDIAPALLQGTAVHEAGHTLGLLDIDVAQAVMHPSRKNATITGSDTAELVRHYPRNSTL